MLKSHNNSINNNTNFLTHSGFNYNHCTTTAQSLSPSNRNSSAKKTKKSTITKKKASDSQGIAPL